MKIALLSDIHASLPAFEAVLEYQKPDAIYCLGDLVGDHVWPNQVISLSADLILEGMAKIITTT